MEKDSKIVQLSRPGGRNLRVNSRREFMPAGELQTTESESAPSTMIRNLNGSIAFWDPLAEQRYGYPRSLAEGNISHELLRTVFPYPLSRINDELIRRKVWEGELIHTVRDGTRVKVLSRWELFHNDYDGSYHVREVNEKFVPVGPEGAQLSEPAFPSRLRTFVKQKWWWLGPIITLSLTLLAVWFFTHDHSVALLSH